MKKEKKQNSSEISQTEHSYRQLVESIKDYAIFMLDKKGIITSWDQGACKLFGYTRKEIVGKNFSYLFTQEDCEKDVPLSDMKTAVDEGRHLDERQYVRKDKTKFWSSGVLTSSRDKEGSHQGFSKIMRDVTQQTDLHRTAVHNSTHDFLTGLPNRSFFEENLLETISTVKRGIFIAILYMDFDNFKQTNDLLGHRHGDLVLIEIAHRLTRSIRIGDMAARFGGDEFVILAKGLKNKVSIARFSQKIIDAFAEPIRIDKKTIKTSVSAGVALYPSDGKKPSELLRFADIALYYSKKLGGNQYRFYDQVVSNKDKDVI